MISSSHSWKVSLLWLLKFGSAHSPALGSDGSFSLTNPPCPLLSSFTASYSILTKKCKCLCYSREDADYRNVHSCNHMDALAVKLKGRTRTDSKSTQQYAHLGTIPYRSCPLILPVLNCYQFLLFFSIALYSRHALVLHDCYHFSWLKTFSWFIFCDDD